MLAAVGAADLLRECEPRIVEHEDRFELQFGKRLTAADLNAVDPGFSYLDDRRTEAPKMTFLIRTQVEPMSALAAVRRAVEGIDRNRSIIDPRIEDSYLEEQVQYPRYY